jgi:peptidoglycan hydrolase-like protein with peptidoglycan-binding domain
MQSLACMKTKLLALAAAALSCLPASDAFARKKRCVAPRDQVHLTQPLLKQLQAHLVGGGYLRGTIDGRLSPRTRHAIAEFQREYHMAPTGTLDVLTADALLGHEQIAAYVVR